MKKMLHTVAILLVSAALMAPTAEARGRNNSGNNDDTGKNDDTRNNAGNYGYGNGSGYDSNNNQGNTNGKPRFDEIDDFEKL